MSNLILFIFASIGLTHIFVDSKIFMPLREWLQKQTNNWILCKISEIMSCYQCAGQYAGMFCGLCLLTSTEYGLIYNFFLVLCSGFAGSFLSSFAAYYLTYLEAKSIVDK